ncbi:thiol:disulfide interchange protein DsbG [Superficieibacter sp. HKU1]|uniref:thiol:disulfide interchange protein DsbG n=1 Tax=Superficieibacter sp. HKU1 TaxID=3031919 RepID=UPI0023E31D0D|nr:thiol:disulfide interchange protein DsbG [Superficieibacter sp. HKU1]WES70126.1 thiol:disulfide interchange protein DsbG [Superficieibacter sp. HKU1]
MSEWWRNKRGSGIDSLRASSPQTLFQRELYIPQGRQLWKKLNAAQGIKEGNPEEKRKMVVFADPICPYCKQFRAAARPWISSGKVELNTLLVAVINPKSGQYASAILNADDPAKAWNDDEMSDGKKRPEPPASTPKETFNLLQCHKQLMDETGAVATPAIASVFCHSIFLPATPALSRLNTVN